jgi:hypothetical protein
MPMSRLTSGWMLFVCFAIAFFAPRPTLSQTSKNLEFVGSAVLPTSLPDNLTPGEASDIWHANGFTYVGRADNDPRRVEVFDVRNPTAPVLFCPPGQIATTPGSYVEDVLVEGQYLYVAQQDSNPDVDGVRIHVLGSGPTPNCNSSTDTFAPIVPTAHNLFVYQHSNGSKYLIVGQNAYTPVSGSTCANSTDDDSDRLIDCADQTPGAEDCSQDPACTTGVHVLNIDNPATPAYVAFWRDPPDPSLAYCALGLTACSVHDVQAQAVETPFGVRDAIFVASLFDGVYIVDLTDVETPGFDLRTETLAHFGYTWDTPDADGDTLPDLCDTLGLRSPALYLGPTFNNKSHDAKVSPDGTTIWTADEVACGGHAQMWDLATVFSTCSGPGWCLMNDVPRSGEYRVAPDVATGTTNLNDPTSIHQIQFDGSFCYASWYEEGLRVLDISNPIAPTELGFFDTVIPNTDGCYENGAPCASGDPNRMLNRGFFGDWGVSWDDCYFYLSERGTPDNNGGTGVVGEDGEMLVLRYTGGPTVPQPLRVAKDPTSAGDLITSWGDVPFATHFNVYRGTIDSLFTNGVYDHTMIGSSTCDIFASLVQVGAQFAPLLLNCHDAADNDGDTLVDCADASAGGEDCSSDRSCQMCGNGIDDDGDFLVDCADTSVGAEDCSLYPSCHNYYYLVTARSPCDDAANREGNYGQDSFGFDRPAADTIPTCPTCDTCSL